jgi:hypothetical protein
MSTNPVRKAAHREASVTLNPYAYCLGTTDGTEMNNDECQWHHDGEFDNATTAAKDHARATGHRVITECVTRSLYVADPK